MTYNKDHGSFSNLRQLLFLILFFKEDGFAFRYPMNVFFDKKIEEASIIQKWRGYNNQSGNLQLYIHSIFCDTRCNYCDCESLIKVNNADTSKYKDYLLADIAKYWKVIEKPLDSLYFWGWTFNLLSDPEIIELCQCVKDSFTLSKECRWQVEIHPYYLTDSTLEILKDFWVTDLMLWIQTTSIRVNALNNRKFDLIKLDTAIDSIIKLWFKKVSFDMMYNLPFMTLEDTRNDLEYAYLIWEKIKRSGMSVNIEINRWDLSMRTSFANMFLSKWWKDKFFDICKYYIGNSKKVVGVVNQYIDEKFLWLFDTHREEIEERKNKNTAILWFWLSATSYIPGVLAYENTSYNSWKDLESKFVWYELKEIDNDLSFISDNLRRWIEKKKFTDSLNKSEKIESFYDAYKDLFIEKDWYVRMNVNTDIENDLLNLYLIDDKILDSRHSYLLSRWTELWFSSHDLEKQSGLFLEYYYNRNKLYW